MAKLSEAPLVHEGATVIDCRLGRYTEVMAGALLVRTEMGDYSYVAGNNDVTDTRIGKFANIASGVRINPGNHPHWRASQHHFMYRAADYWADAEDEAEFFEWRRARPCVIGHDTWLGHNAVVLAGVTVGTGAIVGAGAVVSKDVAPYTVVGGVAAAPIKRRHRFRVAERLMALAWWDWDHARLRAALPDFRALSVEAFLEKYER